MNPALYDFAKGMFRVLFALWRFRVRGADNVPRTGRVIVACNHLSYFDPPVLGTACPRRLHYMAKKELFEIPVLGSLITAVGTYPVDRRGSATAAVKRSVEVLRREEAIGIFPEGTRNLTGTNRVQGGVALLASLANAPVVPARILGTARAKRFARFEVLFGPAMRLPEDRKATREDLANFTEQVMQAIHTLPETLRGN